MDVSKREISPKLETANVSTEKLLSVYPYPMAGKCSPGNMLGHMDAYAEKSTRNFKDRYNQGAKVSHSGRKVSVTTHQGSNVHNRAHQRSYHIMEPREVPPTKSMLLKNKRTEISDLFRRARSPRPFRTSYDTREISGTMQHDRYNHLLMDEGTDCAETTTNRFQSNAMV